MMTVKDLMDVLASFDSDMNVLIIGTDGFSAHGGLDIDIDVVDTLFDGTVVQIIGRDI